MVPFLGGRHVHFRGFSKDSVGSTFPFPLLLESKFLEVIAVPGTGMGNRVVDLALNQAAKPWFHQYLDPGLVPSVAGCFPNCIGDKSATSGIHSNPNFQSPHHPTMFVKLQSAKHQQCQNVWSSHP